MKTRLFFAALTLLFSTALPASAAEESIAYEIGRTGRQVHDSVQVAGRFAAETTQNSSDWFVEHLAITGGSLSDAADDVWSRIDLFFYNIRIGYESNP